VDRLTASASDLFTTTLTWTRRWFDPSCSLVWNPSADGFGRTRAVHLVPNSARFAYGLLATGDGEDERTAISIIERLISLQYGLDGGPAAGTYRIVLEAPDLPRHPRMWTDYDPNWRQFVGTVFALMLEDFADRLPASLAERMTESIRKAVVGEPVDRLTPGYTNPALLRAWLDTWTGLRLDDAALVERGQTFAHQIVEEFDRWSAFDEFNSPTYYGVDLVALGLWRGVSTTALLAEQGERLEEQLWQHIASYFNPTLRNFCGPYTRSYHPDATRSVAEVALWIWGAFGRDVAPLPDLDAIEIHHSHDLMWGPVVARLVHPPASVAASAFREASTRTLRQTLDGGREIDARIEPGFMVGVESSEHDWGGWDQFMPLVAHWREENEQSVCVLALENPRVVRGTIDDRRVGLELPKGPVPVTFRLYAHSCRTSGRHLSTGTFGVTFAGLHDKTTIDLQVTPLESDAWRVSVRDSGSANRLSLQFGA